MSGLKQSIIKMNLNRKLEDVANSIENEVVKRIFLNNVIVSGGCIPNMLMGEKVNDYDLYFKTKEATLEISKYFVELFKTKNVGKNISVVEEEVENINGVLEDRIKIFIRSSGACEGYNDDSQENTEESCEGATYLPDNKNPINDAEEMAKELKAKGEKYFPIFLTDNAITLKNKVQLIIRFFGNPEEIHNNFDFRHCICYYDYHKQQLMVPQAAMQDMLAKELTYNGSLYPITSLLRVRKYIKRGWRISAGQMLKMMMQVQKVDFKNPHVLREQLMGVDSFYMNNLIVALENNSEKVDENYLARLIDEVFE